MKFLRDNPYLALGVAFVLVGGIFVGATYLPQEMSDTTAPVSDMTYAYEGDIKFEIADTSAKQSKGLSGRAEIPDDYGMLFVFPEPVQTGFWMKDMLVSIDIIWLTDRGEIVGIEHSVSPDTYPDVFYPPMPISYVLETRAGYANEKGWTVGTSIYLPNLE
jgi:uncharacterized membrane protein (UPF0127 family)